MALVLTSNGCGCLRLIRVEDDVMVGAYINQQSSQDPNANDYIPYISETLLDTYYVPEDYNEMSTPRYHSEDSNAPSLNAMSLFVGIQDNGDGTFTNYNFTPAQLVGYFGGQVWQPKSIAASGNTVTNAFLAGDVYDIIEINEQPYRWAIDGVSLGVVTKTGDTMDFTQLGGITGYLGFQYRNLP